MRGQATFTVFEDFMQYKGGIYRYVTGREVGRHAVKVLGWGQDSINGSIVEYWLCANSWGPDWVS